MPGLQQPKTKPREETLNETPEHESHFAHSWQHVRKVIQKSTQDFGFYFRHPAFLPSFAGALLYLTVLSFAGQMVTYLLSAGYSATQIGIARTLSVTFEVLATWLAPWLMGRIGPIRAGIWLAGWQIVCLVAGISVFWALLNRPTISASGLVGATILSRIGLRGFDLCTQIIIQEVSHPHTPDRLLPVSSFFVSCSSPASVGQVTQAYQSILHIGRRSRSSGILLLCRSCLAKCVRALLLSFYYHILTPRPI